MRDKKDKSEVVVHENGRDSVSEAFRIVRTNMDFMRVKDKKMQVVMFTSFNPGAGKTFVSMNLAMSFALTHKKVVLVDLDIRKGTLSSHVRVSDKGSPIICPAVSTMSMRSSGRTSCATSWISSMPVLFRLTRLNSCWGTGWRL